jgi:hypothetical protein
MLVIPLSDEDIPLQGRSSVIPPLSVLISRRKQLLVGLTLALPFLGVRTAYAVLAAWSSSDLFGMHPSPNAVLAKFNPVTSGWVPFLVMSLIMEYVVAILYLLFSTVLAQRHVYV